jgi:hypothetical protein
LWAELDGLVATKQPRSYDQAVELLGALRELDARGKGGDFRLRIEALRQTQTRKHSFIDRLRKAACDGRGQPAAKRDAYTVFSTGAVLRDSEQSQFFNITDPSAVPALAKAVLVNMASRTKPLTNTELKQTKPTAVVYTLADGDGLQLRTKPNGSKIWSLDYRRPYIEDQPLLRSLPRRLSRTRR